MKKKWMILTNPCVYTWADIHTLRKTKKKDNIHIHNLKRMYIQACNSKSMHVPFLCRDPDLGGNHRLLEVTAHLQLPLGCDSSPLQDGRHARDQSPGFCQVCFSLMHTRAPYPAPSTLQLPLAQGKPLISQFY